MIESLMHTPATLAQAMVLISWWKPLLLLIPFIPWAWVISSVYDKHAAQFFLPRRKWNVGHLSAGLIAMMGGILLGMAVGGGGAFWACLGFIIVVLVGDLVAYMVVANKDDRVPEKYHIRLGMGKLDEDAKAQKGEQKTAGKVSLAIRAPDDKGKFSRLVAAPIAETPEYEVRTASEAALLSGMRARASQVEVGPTGKEGVYGVSWLVDGVRQSGESMPAANAARIIAFWQAAAGLDPNDRRRKQQAPVQVEEGMTKNMVRVTTIGAQGGLKLTMLLNPEQAVIRKIDDLGLMESQLKELRAIAGEAKGVVLLSSPLDGGRTTTLYSVLRMHDAYTSNVQTVEIEPQAAIEGVRTNKFDPTGASAPAAPGAPTAAPGGDFSTLTRAILRRDPDVVGVAELPDPQTAKEIAKADHERTRVYLSFGSGDVMKTIQAYVKAVGDPRLAADSLHGVVNQRLARRLCTNCRVPYPPTAEMLKTLGISDASRVPQLFKKGGQVLIKNKPEICPACSGIGYLGQEGLFEVYSIGKEERDLIAANNYQGLKAAFRKKSLPTLQQVAIRKAVDGLTSVEEIMRVTTSDAPPATGQSPASPPPQPQPA